MTKIALTPPPRKPLPILVKPARDERLSSWLERIAGFYRIESEELLWHCGVIDSGNPVQPELPANVTGPNMTSVRD